MIEDGVYDVIIVDANDDSSGAMHLEVAISSGLHRGEIVTIVARHLERRWAELLATPAVLTVREGHPTLSFD